MKNHLKKYQIRISQSIGVQAPRSKRLKKSQQKQTQVVKKTNKQTPRHIIITMKHRAKTQSIESSQEKNRNLNTNISPTELSNETLQVRREWWNIVEKFNRMSISPLTNQTILHVLSNNIGLHADLFIQGISWS